MLWALQSQKKKLNRLLRSETDYYTTLEQVLEGLSMWGGELGGSKLLVEVTVYFKDVTGKDLKYRRNHLS